jgi:hypothetical protein
MTEQKRALVPETAPPKVSEAAALSGPVSRPSAQEVILPDDDHTLHELGLKYEAISEVGKAVSLQKALLIYRARQLFCKMGPNSRMNAWLSRYCPDLNRKQADRLAGIVEYFTKGESDKLSDFEKLFEQFRLSALYLLAVSSVPEPAREAALLEARGGKLITMGVARELIDRHTVPQLASFDADVPTATRNRKKTGQTIEVDGGKVVVRSTDGDTVKILKAALKHIERFGS